MYSRNFFNYLPPPPPHLWKFKVTCWSYQRSSLQVPAFEAHGSEITSRPAVWFVLVTPLRPSYPGNKTHTSVKKLTVGCLSLWTEAEGPNSGHSPTDSGQTPMVVAHSVTGADRGCATVFSLEKGVAVTVIVMLSMETLDSKLDLGLADM